MSALVFYPRALVRMSTKVVGEDDEVQTDIVPSSARIVRKPHQQAGTCEVRILASALPFEPRQIEAIFITVFLTTVPSMDAPLDPSALLPAFSGYVDTLEVSREERGQTVSMHARDLSALLRDRKPVSVAAIPRYSDTLEQAIARIRDSVPGASDLAIRDTQALGVSLGIAVGQRVKNAHVALEADSSAWDAIEKACGLVGRLVSVEGNEIVVRNAGEIWGTDTNDGRTKDPAAFFVYNAENANLLSVDFKKKFLRNRRGVKVVSTDEAGRERLEARFPIDGKLPPKKLPKIQQPRGHNSKKGKAPPPDKDKERDTYVVRGVNVPSVLNFVAESIYRERSRQEIEGSCVTPIWDEQVLGLGNGDLIRIAVSPEIAVELATISDDSKAADFLQRRLAIQRAAAEVLVRSSRRPQTSAFYVNTVTHSFSSNGRAETSVEFINFVDLRTVDFRNAGAAA